MNSKRIRSVLLAVAVACGATATLRAYVFLGSNARWPDGTIVMNLQLGSSGALADGSQSWGQAAEAALAIWNVYLGRASFRVVRDSTAPLGDGNGTNNVFWSSSVYGRSFPAGQYGSALAITTVWTRGTTRTEADVIFNNTYFFNSYRGPLRTGTVTGRTYDFRRVAIHEFGHVLGLDHPDQHGQNVVAQMNATTGDLDTLAADDIQGAQALYGGAPPTPPPTSVVISFPPRNESLDFRTQLESKYRDGLRRPGQSTYVDNEGDVVWTQEYLRYRVNQCTHSVAVNNVMTAINGSSAPPVCGNPLAGQVIFPPRNESLDFRIQLEAKYRDGLRRAPVSSSVDNEGDVVWTQEYLRFRVNGCTHGDAVQKVNLEIDGRGNQPVCQ